MTHASRLFGHPLPALAFRLYMGGLFVYAAMYKINYAAEFASTIASYRIVPWWGVNLMAVFMPWLELVAGVMLLAGFRLKAAAAVIAGLLVIFIAGLVINLLRGSSISCGCFHTLEDAISWWTVLRDLAWLAMTLHVFHFDRYIQVDRALVRDLKEIAP